MTGNVIAFRSRTVRLNWHPADRILLSDCGPNGEMFDLVRREPGGYLFKAHMGGDERRLTDEEIWNRRLDGNIVHYPAVSRGLSVEQHELLTMAFDVHSPAQRLVAEIRVAYCRKVDMFREQEHLNLRDCFKKAIGATYEEEIGNWTAQFEANETIQEADRKKLARLPADMTAAGRSDGPGRSYLQPATYWMVEDWWRLWASVGRDRRILVPLWAKRGNRKPKISLPFGVDVYAEMRTALTSEYYNLLQPKLTTVHDRLNKRLRNDPRLKGKLAVERDSRGAIVPWVSYDALHKFKKREFTRFEELAGRKGLRHARMRLDVFKRITYDMPAMEEIEIDHHLLDVVVVHETSGRPLGRPWLTLAIDRSTRMVVGLHVSFEPPSYASLQRCLMHMMWPKDLRGLPLINPWPCEGVPKRIFVDNGREFYSSSLRSAELALGFTLVHLPVRTPNLKGIIERFFGTLEIGVLDFEAGKTFCNALARGEYKSVRKARIKLSELRWKLLHWIVDEYHTAVHSTLDASPLERWYQKVPEGGVCAVSQREDLLGLLGSARSKPINSNGVQLFGQFYFHKELKALRHANGEKHRYEVRSDPYDIGSIMLLTPNGRWLTLESDRPERSKGVSVHQNMLRRSLARTLVPVGKTVEETHLDQAILLLDEANARVLGDRSAVTTATGHARYGTQNGVFLTPVAGLSGRSIVDLDPAPPVIDMMPVAQVEAPSPVVDTSKRKPRKTPEKPTVVAYEVVDEVSDDEMDEMFRLRLLAMEKN